MFERAMADARGKAADCPIELRAMLRLRIDGEFCSATHSDVSGLFDPAVTGPIS
jgi:hypothetical protein